MSEYNEYVVKAAKYLDEYAKKGTFPWIPIDWRSKINVDTLDMSSVRQCILGQLHPDDYDGAVRNLTNHDRSAFYELDTAFSGYGADWKGYIKDTRPNLRVDSQWSHAYGRDVTIKALIEIDNAKHVVYAVNDSGNIWVKSEADFLDGRTEIVKLGLKKGDQITFKDYTGDAMFYWCSDDLVIRVENSEIGHSSLKYYRESYGTPRKGVLSQDVRFEKISNAWTK